MLQPSQIETVSLRFPAEIEEVRAFLRSTGIAVETPAAIGEMVHDIGASRAFHRDLGSHAWMLLYSGATVPETLGVLAVAAAGPRYAANADADDAHDLLRFVMELRNALSARAADRAASEASAVPAQRPVAAAILPTPAGVPQEPAAVQRPVAIYQPGTLRSITPSIVVHDDQPHRVEGHVKEEAFVPRVRNAAPTNRGRIALAAAACLLALAGTGWWFVHRPADDTASATPAPVVEGNPPATAAPPVIATPQPAPETAASTAPDTAPQTFPQARQRGRPAAVPAPRSPQAHGKPSAASTWTSPVQPQQSALRAAITPPVNAPVTATRPAAPPASGTTTPVVASPAAAKGSPVPVPSSVLASRLGSPVVNQADAVDDRVAGTKGYPRLLRRKQLDAIGTLVAKNTSGPAANGVSSRAAFSGGTVRSTSLGITAGNLVYAPDPVYPSAAASQHVTGQVTVQAMVDREGNVASARVISGPPMLRDAAVTAIQQWRYRPFTAGGKPQTFTATAVVDFQLP